jgi:hypothetical protein
MKIKSLLLGLAFTSIFSANAFAGNGWLSGGKISYLETNGDTYIQVSFSTPSEPVKYWYYRKGTDSDARFNRLLSVLLAAQSQDRNDIGIFPVSTDGFNAVYAGNQR